jgi:hypothetical protein
MYKVITSLLVTVGLCAACSDPAIVSAPDTQVFAGAYIFGHEVNSFEECGAGLSYWVRSSDGVAAQIRNFYEVNTNKPYQPIYIEFEGKLTDGKASGFAADYDGLIQVDRLLTLSAAIPDDCG